MVSCVIRSSRRYISCNVPRSRRPRLKDRLLRGSSFSRNYFLGSDPVRVFLWFFQNIYGNAGLPYRPAPSFPPPYKQSKPHGFYRKKFSLFQIDCYRDPRTLLYAIEKVACIIRLTFMNIFLSFCKNILYNFETCQSSPIIDFKFLAIGDRLFYLLKYRWVLKNIKNYDISRNIEKYLEYMCESTTYYLFTFLSDWSKYFIHTYIYLGQKLKVFKGR